jgi:hypothetical protein
MRIGLPGSGQRMRAELLGSALARQLAIESESARVRTYVPTSSASLLEVLGPMPEPHLQEQGRLC